MWRVENHEPEVVVTRKGLKEFKSEPAQPVFVSDNQLFDLSAHDALQYGEKSFSLKVEAAADVGNDFVIRELLFEESGLSREIVFLPPRADSCVAYPRAFFAFET